MAPGKDIKIPKLRGRDLAFVLVSLVAAFVIWLIHNLSLDYSGVISVPVRLESNLPGRSALSYGESVAVARCRTSGFNLVRAAGAHRRNPVKVKVDRSDLRYLSGDEFCVTVPALGNYVQRIFGDGVALEAFITDTLRFIFPRENHKKVPVVVPQELYFKPQYMASSALKVEPDSVIVYADAGRLEMVDRVYTVPLVASNLRSGIHGSLKLKKINGVRLSEDQVEYSLGVTRFVELRSSVPVAVRNAPAGVRIQVYPSTAEVTIRCVFPLLSDPSESVRLYVDYDDFAASITGRCMARTGKLPQGVIDVRIEPEFFDCLEALQ